MSTNSLDLKHDQSHDQAHDRVHVYSEIAPLRRVLLHRPGEEFNNLTPTNMHRLLFDDLPDLERAQEEHDAFAQLLRDAGVEVLYLEDLMLDVLRDDFIRHAFIQEYLQESGLDSKSQSFFTDYFKSVSPETLLKQSFSGLRRSDFKTYQPKTLMAHLKREDPMLIDPMPNLFFQRDAFSAVGKGVSLSCMRTLARCREEIYPRYIFTHHPKFKGTPFYFDRKNEGHLEGGDVLVFSPEIVGIGLSERTDPEALSCLALNLLTQTHSFKHVLAFKLPKERAYMHLDTVFTMIDHSVFTIHQATSGPFELYDLTLDQSGALSVTHLSGDLEDLLKTKLGLDEVTLIRCGEGHPIDGPREQWNDGSNTLAIAPGEVVVYERNRVTNEALRKAGIKTHELVAGELSRGRGGPRCMSMPLWRDDL